jgi:oxaloacetate decarboxylase gamma subunit
MNVNDLLIQSLQLLGLGMGSVFVILTMLIVIVTLISRVVPESIPSPIPTPVQEKKQETLENTEHIAVIQAAIHKFRRSRTH